MEAQDASVRSCECGCGKGIAVGKRFVHGHHVRVNNPMHTQTAKDKMSRFWTGRKRPGQTGANNVSNRSDVLLKLSTNNPMHNPEHRAAQKAGCLTAEEVSRRSMVMTTKNPSYNEDALRKRIDTYTSRLASGQYHIRNRWKTGWYTRVDGTQEWYDSSYELTQMQEYDRLGVKWTKKHGIRIPYVDEHGRPTFYVPDFLVEDGPVKSLVEVKGWMRASVVTKAKVAIDFCKTHGYKYFLLLGQQRTMVDDLSFSGASHA